MIVIGGPGPKALAVHVRPGHHVATVLRRFDKPPEDPSRLPVDWEDEVRVRFPDAGVPDWVATINGNAATFAVPSSAVDALIATNRHRAVIDIGGVNWGAGVWVIRS